MTAEVAVGTGNDIGCFLTLTDNGMTMKKLAIIHDNNQDAGYMDVFALANPPSGVNTLRANVANCPWGSPDLTAGSLLFSGADLANPYGAVASATGSGTTASATIPSANGDMIAGFAANGSPVTSVNSPATSRFIQNLNSNTGAGNSAGATSVSTGSGVSVSWNLNSDWWSAGVLQIQHG
jgi:hypothetical protein